MVSIHEAAEFLGVSAQTFRRWEREGKLIADERTPGGRRRYNLARLSPEQFHASDCGRRTIAYARVSSHDQKDDLERQKQGLELYCAIGEKVEGQKPMLSLNPHYGGFGNTSVVQCKPR